jgi:uncharacterized protein (TIGR00725 family)
MGYKMNVTVFGGSQPKPNSTAYTDAFLLGKLLAQAGHTVLTGGYIGSMEAVSRGANEAGGHVIGVTCREIERWRAVGANAWVQEERKFDTLRQRLDALIDGCEAAIALPGGPGTLTEISLMWNLMIVDAIPRRPLILIGNGWRSIFDQAYAQLSDYFVNTQRALILFSPDIHTAVHLLDKNS